MLPTKALSLLLGELTEIRLIRQVVSTAARLMQESQIDLKQKVKVKSRKEKMAHPTKSLEL